MIGLDGVVAQEGNYQRSGFVTVHRNMRYRGVVPEEATDASPPPRACKLAGVICRYAAPVVKYPSSHRNPGSAG